MNPWDELIDYLFANPHALRAVERDLNEPDPGKRTVVGPGGAPFSLPGVTAVGHSRGTPADAAGWVGGAPGPQIDHARPYTPSAITDALAWINRHTSNREGNHRLGEALVRGVNEAAAHPIQTAADLSPAWAIPAGASVVGDALKGRWKEAGMGAGALALGMAAGPEGGAIRHVLKDGRNLELNLVGDLIQGTIDGKPAVVGTLTRTPEGKAFVQTLLVPDAHRRQGVGRAVFEALDKSGVPLVPNPGVHTEAGQALEDSFFRRKASEPERAVAAAYRLPDGTIESGPHHGAILERLGLDTDADGFLRDTEDPELGTAGFLTNRGNFKTREEAGRLHKTTVERPSSEDLPFFDEGAYNASVIAPPRDTPPMSPLPSIPSGGNLGPDLSRFVAPAPTVPEVMTLDHYGPGADQLDFIDPAKHGSGQIGAERGRREAYPDQYAPRSYFYAGGSAPEPRFNGLPKTSVQVPRGKIATQEQFTDFFRQAQESAPAGMGADRDYLATAAENLAREAGFEGYQMGNVVAKFTPTQVRGVAGDNVGLSLRPEKVRSATVHDPNDPGRVYRGANHGEAWNEFYRANGVPERDIERGLTPRQDRELAPLKEGLISGFETDRGRRITREEAGALTKGNGQAPASAPDRMHSDSLRGQLSGVASSPADALAPGLMEEGGFTLHPTTGESMGGQDFWAVAPSKTTERVFNRPITAEDVAAYRRDFGHLLSQEGAHLGGWKDGDRRVLDVSQLFPGSDTDAAVAAGARAKQDAIFHLGRYEERPITPDEVNRYLGAAGDNVGIQFRPQSRGVFDREAPQIQGQIPSDPRLVPVHGPRSSPSQLVEEILNNPKPVVNLLNRDIERGLRAGGPEWYELGPVKADLDARGGGALTFGQFNSMGVGASAQNSVPGELSAMSIANFARKRGISLDEAKAIYDGTTRAPRPLLAQGHLNSGLFGIENGVILPADLGSDAWKLPSYFGMRQGGGGLLDVNAPGAMPALDTHERRRIMQGVNSDPGLSWVAQETAPSPKEQKTLKGMIPLRNSLDYQALSSLYVDAAQRYGLPTAGAAQASRWLGGAAETGLQTAPVGDFVQLLEDQLLYTAQRRGLDDSPRGLQNLWGRVVNGDDFILPWGSKKPLPLRPQSR